MRFVTACTLLAAATLGQADPDFLSADKSLSEQSYARACDGFNAFLKAHADSPLAREAQAKRAASCLRVGRGNTYNELVTLATKGEKDFARAYASWELAQRGERSFDEALALLKQAASGDDRQAKQARALFIAGALRQMENESYNQKKVEQLAAQGLELAGPADAAHLRLLRARTHAQQTKTQPAAEEEFLAVGKGDTQWADNALYDCARLREGLEKYDGALELYDEIVRRFQRSTSDVWESAKSEAAEIRRPWVQLSIGTVELPGVKPIVSWSARNVSDNSLRWQVEKIDPFAQEAAGPFSGDHGAEALHGPVVSQWNQAVKPKSNHAQVNGSFDLQLTDKGAYVVQAVDAAGHRSRAFALITTHVTVLKAGAGQAVVWVVDAITGQAVKDAPVRLFEHDGYEHYRRLEGTTDTTGLARFELVDANQNSQSLIAIAKAAGSFSYSNGYANWRGSAEREELLAWGVTDRPLYKPGEKVGLKVFLRSRAAGPSVPVAKEEVVVSVRDPQGREVARPSLTSSAFGTVSFDFPLPKNAPLGQWSFYLEDSHRSFSMSSSSFRVEEYKPPEYTVSVTPASKPKPGAAFKVKIAASFFFGGPVANASGRALVNVTAWQHQWARWPDEAEDEGNGDGDGYGYGDDEGYGFKGRYGRYYGNAYFAAQHTLPFKTGADGTAEVEVPAEQVPEGLTGLQYQITALVTDASRREVRGQATLHVAKDSYFADVRTDRFLYKPGEKVRVELRAEDANGEPAVARRLGAAGEAGRGRPGRGHPLAGRGAAEGRPWRGDARPRRAGAGAGAGVRRLRREAGAGARLDRPLAHQREQADPPARARLSRLHRQGAAQGGPVAARAGGVERPRRPRAGGPGDRAHRLGAVGGAQRAGPLRRAEADARPGAERLALGVAHRAARPAGAGAADQGAGRRERGRRGGEVRRARERAGREGGRGDRRSLAAEGAAHRDRGHLRRRGAAGAGARAHRLPLLVRPPAPPARGADPEQPLAALLPGAAPEAAGDGAEAARPRDLSRQDARRALDGRRQGRLDRERDGRRPLAR